MFRATSWNGTFQDFESDFKPIPSLDRPDGTLGLVFLVGNGVIFFEEGADDWYRATVRGSGSLHREHANGSTPQYLPEEAASPLACVQQFQFCRGDATSVDENRDCGPLGGWWDAFMGAGHLFGVTDPYEIFNNPNSTNTPGNRFIWLIGTINYFAEQPNEIPLYASSRKLLSELRMVDGIQFGLYSDQWKRDITHWWSTWLTASVGGKNLRAATAPLNKTGEPRSAMPALFIIRFSLGSWKMLYLSNSRDSPATGSDMKLEI